MKTFFEVTVGGKHCVGRQPDKRGAEKGCIPHKARFPEQLFGLARVPAEHKEARTRRASMGLCGVVLAYYASAVMRACHHSNASSGMPAQILALPMLLSGSNVTPLVCSANDVCTSYDV